MCKMYKILTKISEYPKNISVTIYTTSQILAEYLGPLNDSKYIITDTLKFPSILEEHCIISCL